MEEIKQLSAHLPVVIFTLSLKENGRPAFLYASAGAQKLLQLCPAEMVQTPASFFDRLALNDHYAFIASLQHAIAINGEWTWEGKYQLSTGSYCWLRGQATLSQLPEENVFTGLFTDVSDYKNNEADLLQSQTLLHETGQLGKIGCWGYDLEANSASWSPEMYRLHEVELSVRPINVDPLSFFPGKARDLLNDAVIKTRTAGIPFELELPFITTTGKKLWVRSTGKAVMENGRVVRMYGALQDITEYRLAEERLNVVFEYSTDAHLLFDETGIIDCNNAAIKMLGYNSKSALLKTHPAAFSPEYQPDGRLSAEKSIEMDRLAREKGYHQFEWVHSRYDGSEVLMEVTLNPVSIQDKVILLVVWHDISERKRAEEQIRRSEAMLMETQELTHSGSWEYDLLTGKNFWSAEAFRIFELKPDKEGPDTYTFGRMIHPEDRVKYLTAIKEAIQNGLPSNFDLRIVMPDGRIKQIQAIGKPLYNDQGVITRLTGAIIDITEMKRKEEALRLRTEQLKAFVEYSPAAIAMLDRDMRYIVTSNIWKASYKLTNEQIAGKIHYEVFPEMPAHWKALHQRCLQGEVLRNEEDSFIRQDGRVEWLRWEIRPWYENEDEIGGMIMFTEVITEQREAKEALIKAKEQAEQATIAKSQFLSVMSHEIRTPMNAVIGFTNLLMQNPREDQKEYLGVLKFSAENLLVLINDILDFSKIEAGKIEFEEIDFNMHELLTNIKGAVQKSATEKNIGLRLKLDNRVPEMLQGDPVRIGQILTNLLSNAVKFTHQGEVTLHAKLHEEHDGTSTIYFEVQDTGIGIPADKQQAIFNSFTQASSHTTRKYGGTGLGLTITKRLLEMYGSEIQVNSVPGTGSSFYFYLSLRKSSNAAANKQTAAAPVLAKNLAGTKLLLVEDNQFNVLLARQFLEQWCIQYDVADNGLAAVHMVQQHDYDLVLMDLQMPEMDGYEATAEIRKLPGSKYQTLPILALTASAMLDIQHKAFSAGMNDYISKPFNPEELYLKIVTYARTTCAK